MRRLESGTAGSRSAGDAALQVPGPRPADPEGHPASAVRRPRARSRTPRSRTAVGTRPEAIGPPATGSLTETLLTEFAPETSRKARPDCRQDAAMARRTAPRIRKWIRALKRLVAPFGAPSPSPFAGEDTAQSSDGISRRENDGASPQCRTTRRPQSTRRSSPVSGSRQLPASTTASIAWPHSLRTPTRAAHDKAAGGHTAAAAGCVGTTWNGRSFRSPDGAPATSRLPSAPDIPR